MKILGIGIDLVKNSKIKNAVNKSHAERFIKKFLHPK
jgi:phosphopantetheinyl transferase (holo-ACP synthase)